MPTVFTALSDGFYTAFFELDPEKRKIALDSWIKQSTPIIQTAVEDELKAYLTDLLDATWTEKGWDSRAKKFFGQYQGMVRKKGDEAIPFIDAYQLQLSLKILLNTSKDIYNVVGENTPEIRIKLNEAIEKAKWAIAGNQPPDPIDIRAINLHEDHTVEKAIPIVKSFLDECCRDNVRRIRIIHGKGIGVLRQAVTDYLEIHRYIIPDSISFADKDHGGEGATEARLVDFSANNLDPPKPAI